MNTLALKKEAKTFGLKQILLTLRKGPEHCSITAVIAPIGKDLEVEITNKKMIRIPSRNGHDTFLKERRNLETIDIHDRLRPRLTQVPISTRKSLLIMKECSVVGNTLASESAFRKKFTKILSNKGKDDGLKNKQPLEQSILNKQDRFVPNILRSTKAAENTFNNNSLIGCNPTHTPTSHETGRHCKDYKNVKRKRKQVLGSLNIECDCSCNTQTISKEKDLNKSILRSCKTAEAEEENQNLEITVTKSGEENCEKCPEIKPGISATAQQLTMGSGDSKDLCSAALNIPYKTENLPNAEETYINCNYDKSMKKIFAEFEVPDYQNYIDREDLGFDIDEMDKLLSSEIEDSLNNSSIFDHSTKIMEYDVNGNDIENHGSLFEKSNENKLNARNIPCKIEPCYHDRAETKINTSNRQGCDINVDDIYSRAFNSGRSYERSESNLWSNEFEDYYPNNEFQDLLCSIDRDSPSTDTASESEANEFNSTRTSSLMSPKNKNLECFATSLVVGDMVPDNVFSNDSNESYSDGFRSDDYTVKRSLPPSPLMQQYHLSSEDSNENKYCPSLSSIPLETLAKKLAFCDDFDTNLEIFEGGNFLEDNMLNSKCTFSKEDETCETILANSNAKFDDKHVSSIHSDLADFDFENADDLEISRLLRLGKFRVNNFTSVSDVTLQPYEINATKNKSGTDVADQLNTNDMIMSNEDNSQFGTMNFENLPYAQDESITNAPICLEGVKFSFNSEVETRLQECYTKDKEFEHSDSTLANRSSDCNELLWPCDGKMKDIDCTTSSSRCSPVLSIENRNMTGLKMSKLESLLTRRRTCADNPNAQYWLAVSGNVGTDARVTTIENCSEVEGYSDVHILHSTVSPYRICDSQVTGYKNIEDVLYSNMAQKRNPSTESTVITVDDDEDNYSIAERRNHYPLESELTHNQDSYNSQSVSYSVSSNAPPSSRKHPTNLTKPKRGIWQDLVKRSKFVAQYISSYIPCDFCENKYSSQATLADHIQFSHRHRPSRFRFRDKKYVCDKCSKEYMFPGAIKKHFKLHENYVLTCKICEKHFSEKIFLRRHVYGMHLNWQQQCTYCSQKFSQKNALSRHIRKYHSSEDFCGGSIV